MKGQRRCRSMQQQSRWHQVVIHGNKTGRQSQPTSHRVAKAPQKRSNQWREVVTSRIPAPKTKSARQTKPATGSAFRRPPPASCAKPGASINGPTVRKKPSSARRSGFCGRRNRTSRSGRPEAVSRTSVAGRPDASTGSGSVRAKDWARPICEKQDFQRKSVPCAGWAWRCWVCLCCLAQ